MHVSEAATELRSSGLSFHLSVCARDRAQSFIGVLVVLSLLLALFEPDHEPSLSLARFDRPVYPRVHHRTLNSDLMSRVLSIQISNSNPSTRDDC